MGRLRVKNNVLEQRIFTGRVTLAGAIVALLLFTILGRLFYLQVVQHSYYADLSQGNRIRKPEAGAAGSLLDLSATRKELGKATNGRFDGYYPSLHLTFNANLGFFDTLNDNSHSNPF